MWWDCLSERALLEICAYQGISVEDFLEERVALDQDIFQHILGSSILIDAVRENNLPLVKELLDHGARLDRYDTVGLYPIHIAVLGGFNELIACLVSRGADPNTEAEVTKKTPLMIAIEHENISAVQHLIACGAKIVADSGCQPSLLDQAISKFNIELIEVLLIDLLLHTDKTIDKINSKYKHVLQIISNITLKERDTLIENMGYFKQYHKFDRNCYLIIKDIIGWAESEKLSFDQINKIILCSAMNPDIVKKVSRTHNTEYLYENWIRAQVDSNLEIPPNMIQKWIEYFAEIEWSLKQQKVVLNKIHSKEDLKKFKVILQCSSINEPHDKDLWSITEKIDYTRSTIDDIYVEILQKILLKEILTKFPDKPDIVNVLNSIIPKMLRLGWEYNSINTLIQQTSVKTQTQAAIRTLNIIANFNLFPTSMDVDDITASSVLSSKPPKDWEQNLYSIIANSCLNKDVADRSVDQIFDVMFKDNNGNKLGQMLENEQIQRRFLEVYNAYNAPDTITGNDKPISEYSLKDIAVWQDKQQNFSDETMTEILAIIIRAAAIYKKYEIRATQIISVLALLETNDKGLLLQIATGEGKSTIIAIFAAFKAMHAINVDIITSSTVLAIRDAADWEEFYKTLGLSSDHNCSDDSGVGPRECYKKNIVYGDVSNFQFDELKEKLYEKGRKCNRGYACAIVDEVDSMLIDECAKTAYIAASIAGAEYLELFLLLIDEHLKNLSKQIFSYDNQLIYVQGDRKIEAGDTIILDPNKGEFFYIHDLFNFKYKLILEEMQELLKDSKFHIPNHLKVFFEEQLPRYVKSAISAQYYHELHNYLISPKSEDIGRNKISIVDNNATGVVHDNLQWQNGLNEFLQIKHNLALSSGSLMGCFISNIAFFKLYAGKIFGLTGTLGSHDAQNLLQEIYDIEVGFIPTHKEKQFIELPGIICKDEKWNSTIVKNVQLQANKGRAVLVICQTIKSAQELHQELLQSGHPENLLKLYSRNDNDEYKSIEDKLGSRVIVIATNLAGRGADFELTEEVKKRGGLHVCLTFLADNLRVEKQALGRAARKGECGTGEIIVKQSYVTNHWHTLSDDIEEVKILRNEAEHDRLDFIRAYNKNEILDRDQLFLEFNKFHHELKTQEDNQHKLGQVRELWSILLNRIERSYDVQPNELILSDIIDKYGFKLVDSKEKIDSLYHSIAAQLGNKISPKQLKILVAEYLAKCYKWHDVDGIHFVDIHDNLIIRALAAILDVNIVLFRGEEGAEPFIVKRNDDTACIYLGFIPATDTQLSYYKTLQVIEKKPLHNLHELIASSDNDRLKPLGLLTDSLAEALKILAYLSTTQKSEIEQIIKNRKQQALKSFEEFKEKIKEQYKTFDILVNPAFLNKQAMDGSIPLASIMSLLNRAINSEEYYNYISYYNRARIHVENNNKAAAIEDLRLAKKQLEDNTLVYLTEMALFAPETGDSGFMQQMHIKLSLAKRHISCIECNIDFLDQVSMDIRVSKIIKLKELWEGDINPDAEIEELEENGLAGFFEIEEYDQDEDDDSFFGTLFTAVFGILQISLGIICLGSGNVALGAALLAEGFMDCIAAVRIAIGDIKFSLEGFMINKALSIAVYAVAHFASKVLTKIGLMKEATKVVNPNAAAAGAVTLDKGAQAAAKQAFINETIKKVGIKVVVDLAIDKLVDSAIDETLRNFKSDISNTVSEKISKTFNNPEIRECLADILTAGAFNASTKYQKEIMAEATKLFAAKQSILRSLGMGVLNKLAKHAQASMAIKAISVAVEVYDVLTAIEKVSEVTGEICDQIKAKIKSLHHSLPSLADLLSKESPSISISESHGIIKLLEKFKVIKNNRCEKNVTKESLEAQFFNEYDQYSKPIIKFVLKLQAAQNIGVDNVIIKMTQQLSSNVTNNILTTAKTSILKPTVSHPLSHISEHVSDGLKKHWLEDKKQVKVVLLAAANEDVRQHQPEQSPYANDNKAADLSNINEMATKLKKQATKPFTIGEALTPTIDPHPANDNKPRSCVVLPQPDSRPYSYKEHTMPATMRAMEQPHSFNRYNPFNLQNTQPLMAASNDPYANLWTSFAVSQPTVSAASTSAMNYDQQIPVLDINPIIKSSDAQYCVIIIYDAGVTDDPNTSNRIGHYYIGIGELKDGVVSNVHLRKGYNPIVSRIRYDAVVLDESVRHDSAIAASRVHLNDRLIIEKAIPITYEQYYEAKVTIELKEITPGTYNIHSNDCISFSQEVIDKIGLGQYKVGDLIDHTSDDRFSFAKLGATLKRIDGKIVPGITKAAVASQYNVPLDRVERSTIQAKYPLFRIIPLKEYLQKKEAQKK